MFCKCWNIKIIFALGRLHERIEEHVDDVWGHMDYEFIVECS